VLQVRDLRKSYGPTAVLDGVGFVVGERERVGLIGPNGSGKSTLLRCIAGVDQPDAGTVVVAPPEATIGYLPQAFAENDTATTVHGVLLAAQADLAQAERAVQAAAEALAHDADAAAAPDMDARLAAYDAALAHFEALGGYDRERRAESVLAGLGLGSIDPATPVAALSGGQKTRLGLATLLLREPAILLLDEPSNHLDVDALAWLEDFVVQYPGAVLVVSHDRELLDHTVERIVWLDPETHAARAYPGNYSAFAAAREYERQLHLDTWRHQQEYVARVERDVARLKDEALGIERATTPREPGVRKLAKKKARLAKAREHKLERYRESDERVDKPRLSWPLNLDFGPPPPGGRDVLALQDVSFAYPGSQTLLAGVRLDVRYGERLALVGPNGSGKTTLLRLVQGAVTPTAGTVRLGANVRLGVLAQEGETLDVARTVLETVLDQHPMSETDARRLLSFFLFYGDAAFRRVGACSLGERTRLQLALLVVRGCNLLLLDEPLNHLDVDGREHFAAALEAFQGTIIAVAHDRAFLRAFARRVLDVRAGQARVFDGGYAFYTRSLAGGIGVI